IAITAALVLVGAVLIKMFGDPTTSDPTATVENGAPRGLLGLRLLLAAHSVNSVAGTRFDDALPPAGHSLVIGPPPERSAWTTKEADTLLARVRAGDDALVLCDEDQERTERLQALLDELGVECERADIPLGDESLTKATGVMPGYARTLYVRGAG